MDKDWIKFTAKAGKLYIIRTTSTLTTTIALHSGLGTLPAIMTSNKPALDSVNNLVWYCPADGQYSFSVLSNSVGAYALDFQEYDQSGYQINVSAPIAGTTAVYNKGLLISWSSLADIRGSVDIFLFNSTGIPQANIALSLTNTGSYTWTVPATLPVGNDYSIRVISKIQSDIMGNSGVFTISATQFK